MFSQSKPANGFTLVELAIVLMIIGLLIGGVLRGQELMTNAKVASTVQQLHSFNAATSAFRDAYGGLPGDIANAANRIPGCTTNVACVPTTTTSLMNGIIGTSVTTVFNGTYGTATGLDTENRRYWSQLAAARMLSGIDPTSTAATANWGVQFPASKLGGGFHIAYMNTFDGALIGHYFLLRNNPANGFASEGVGSALLSPYLAYLIDAKMDQGTPSAGDVRSTSTNAGTGCMYTDTSYTVSDRSFYCVLLIRL